jgi:hypothetical protein
LHGALDQERLDTPTYRYFYFRTPAVPDGIPDELVDDYREEPDSFAEAELARLKVRVKEAKGKVETAPGRVETVGVPVREYPARWDETTNRIIGLKEFGDRVYEDLLGSVEAELGVAPPEALDPFAEENAAAEAFVETRMERYVIGSRQPVFDALLEHAEGTGGNGYLCLVGAPGSGKSALLAKFYRDYVRGAREDVAGGIPARAPHPDDLVIPHFIGVNSTNARELLRRLCHELAAGTDIADEIPGDFDGLRAAFPSFLEQAAGARRVVLLIDALNQLAPTLGATAMTWLPDRLPETARIILTALPRPELDAARTRLKPIVEPLGPLTKDDASEIVDVFLARFRKELDERQRGELLAKKDAGNALYLNTALEELRTLGIYEEIIDRIQELPDEVQPLFLWILERLEGDDGFRDEDGKPIGPELVRAYCSYLAAAREGMTHAELVDLIAPGDEQAEVPPDAQGNVAALEALLRPYLMRRAELLDFFHGQLEEAVDGEYLDEEHERLATHHRLAEYFRHRADPAGSNAWDAYPRGLSELPYHLTNSARKEDEDDDRWQEVTDLLTDFRFLERKAADVGVIEETDAGGEVSRTYTGPYLLQDDYALALRRMPGGGDANGEQRRIIVTATDFGHGLVLRCPHCNVPHECDRGAREFDTDRRCQACGIFHSVDEWVGKEIECPNEACKGPLKVNEFLVERSPAEG